MQKQRFEYMGKGVIVDFLGNHDCEKCPLDMLCDKSKFCNENKADYLRQYVPDESGDFPFLRAAIDRQGYTVRTFAAEIGMAPSTLCEKMSGKVDWKLREMSRISAALGASIDTLFRA